MFKINPPWRGLPFEPRGGSNSWESPVKVVLKGTVQEIDGEIENLLNGYRGKWKAMGAPEGLIRMGIEGGIGWAKGIADMASPDLATARASFKYLMPKAMEGRHSWIKSMMGSEKWP